MTLTRRQLLGSGAGALLAYALRGPLVTTADRVLGFRPALADPVDPVAFPSATAPFTVRASSTLAQDVFTTHQVALPTDGDGTVTATVTPVAHSDGPTAVVAGPDGLSLLRPDPDSPSGSVFTTVTGAAVDATGGLCAASRPDGSIALAFYVGDQWATAVLGLDGTASAVTTVDPGAGVYPATAFRASFAPDGTPTFAALGTTADQNPMLVVTEPATGTTRTYPIVSEDLLDQGPTDLYALVGTLGVTQLVVGVVQTATGTPYLLIEVEGGASARPVAWSGARVTSCYRLLAPFLFTPPGAPDAVAVMLWADSDGHPFLGALGQDGDLLSAPLALLSAPAYGLQPPAVTQAAWAADPVTGQVVCHLLDDGGRLWVQEVDLGTGATSTPVPLADGVTSLDAPQVGATSASTLFVTAPSPELDGTVVLTTLGRAATTQTWVLTPVHTANATHLQLSAYRTVLTVLDADDRPVAGHDLQVTPTFAVTGFDAAGGVVLPAGTATPLTTDATGQVTVAAPATALYAAQLTVVHDPGSGTPESLSVAPDGELHQFLAGGALNGWTSLAAAITANAGPGAAVPGLSPGDTAAVQAVAAAVGAAVQCGFAATGGAAAPAFTLSGLGSGTPVYTPGTAAPRRLLGSWWDDVVHDAESVWHAVERGVAAVSQVQSWFDAAEGYLVRLTLDIAGYVGTEIEYAVTDLRSAAVAVHGIFQALGADLDAVVNFLRTTFEDLLGGSDALAGTLYGWLTAGDDSTDGLGAVYAAIEELENLADDAFSSAESDVEQVLRDLQGRVTGQSITGQTGKTLPASGVSATHLAGDVRAGFLLQKVRGLPPGPPVQTSSGTAGALAMVDTAVGADPVIGQVLQQVLTVVGADDPHGLLTSLSFDQLVAQVLLTATDVALHLLDDALDAMLELLLFGLQDLQSLLTGDLDDVPLLGDLFRVLGLGDVTLGEVFCHLLAVPAVALGDLLFGKGWLPGGLAAGRGEVGASARTWADLLDVLSIVVNLFSIPGIVADDVAYEAAGREAPGKLGALNIVFEVLVNLVAFPFATDDTTGSLEWDPLTLADDNPLLGPHAPLLIWAIGFVPALLDLAASEVTRVPGEAVNQTLDKTLPAVDTALGLVLIVVDVLAAVAEGSDPVAITLSVVSWVSLVMKAFRYGRDSQYVVVSYVFDIGNPPAVVYTLLGGLVAG